MDTQFDSILEELSKRGSHLAEDIKSFDNPELLVKAGKLLRKQVPFRYRRYAAAYLLLKAVLKVNPRRPQNSKENQRPAKKPTQSTDGFVNLYVNIGKRNRVNAGDLSRHFGKILDIPLTKIATVKVLPAFSFIEIEESEAQRAVQMVNGTTLKNRKISVAYGSKK